MKKREIFIVVALIIFGFLYQSFKQVDEGLFREGKLSLRNTRLTSSIRHEFQKPEEIYTNIEAVELINPAGSVSIQPSPDQTVRFLLKGRVYQRRGTSAKRLWKKTEWKPEISGSILKLSLIKPRAFPYQKLRLDVVLSVPVAVKVKVTNSHGKTSAIDLASKLKIDGHFNDVDLRRVSADVEINSDYSDIQIHDISGNIFLNGHFCQVFGETLKGLDFQGRHCDLQLANILEKATIHQEFGSLHLTGAKSADVNGRHTIQSLKEIKSTLTIENSDENTDLKDLQGDVNFSFKRTRLTLKDSELVNLAGRSEDDSLTIEDCTIATARLQLKRNDLIARNTRIKTLFHIESTNSNLDFQASDLPLYFLNLQAAYGKIITNAKTGLQILRENAMEKLTRNTRGPELRFRTEYGDIRIGKGLQEPINPGI